MVEPSAAVEVNVPLRTKPTPWAFGAVKLWLPASVYLPICVAMPCAVHWKVPRGFWRVGLNTRAVRPSADSLCGTGVPAVAEGARHRAAASVTSTRPTEKLRRFIGLLLGSALQ